MQQTIKLFRFVLFVPAMVLGGFLAVIVTAIWNIPLTFLELFGELFGNWSLWEFIFGVSKTSFSEILYFLSSGIFTSAIGLYLGISMYPFQNHRIKVAYFLATLLLISFCFSSQNLLYYEGNIYYFFSKILGLFIGSWVIIRLVKDHKHRELFNFIDRIFT